MDDTVSSLHSSFQSIVETFTERERNFETYRQQSESFISEMTHSTINNMAAINQAASKMEAQFSRWTLGLFPLSSSMLGLLGFGFVTGFLVRTWLPLSFPSISAVSFLIFTRSIIPSWSLSLIITQLPIEGAALVAGLLMFGGSLLILLVYFLNRNRGTSKRVGPTNHLQRFRISDKGSEEKRKSTHASLHMIHLTQDDFAWHTTCHDR